MEPTASMEPTRAVARRASSSPTEERKRLIVRTVVARPTDVWSEAQAAVPPRVLVQQGAATAAGGRKEFVPASRAGASAVQELRVRDLQSVQFPRLVSLVQRAERWAWVAVGCPPAGLKPMAAAK